MILMREALAIMQQKDELGNYKPFSLLYSTFSKKRKEGGKLRYYDNATLTDEATGDKPTTQSKESVKLGRNPYHRRNKTRNVKLANGEINKIYFRFILEFNGQTVVY